MVDMAQRGKPAVFLFARHLERLKEPYTLEEAGGAMELLHKNADTSTSSALHHGMKHLFLEGFLRDSGLPLPARRRLREYFRKSTGLFCSLPHEKTHASLSAREKEYFLAQRSVAEIPTVLQIGKGAVYWLERGRNAGYHLDVFPGQPHAFEGAELFRRLLVDAHYHRLHLLGKPSA